MNRIPCVWLVMGGLVLTGCRQSQPTPTDTAPPAMVSVPVQSPAHTLDPLLLLTRKERELVHQITERLRNEGLKCLGGVPDWNPFVMAAMKPALEAAVERSKGTALDYLAQRHGLDNRQKLAFILGHESESDAGVASYSYLVEDGFNRDSIINELRSGKSANVLGRFRRLVRLTVLLESGARDFREDELVAARSEPMLLPALIQLLNKRNVR